MPNAEEYLAISSSGRVVGGPFRYHSEADTVAKRNGGYVQFVAKEEGDASAMEVVPVAHEARDSHGDRVVWHLEGDQYVGKGRQTGALYIIRPTILKGKTKRPVLSWTLLVKGKKRDVANRTEKLMQQADVIEKDAETRAAEVVPVAHEPAKETPGTCIAIVERKPGCASSGVEIKTAADVYKLLHRRYRKLGHEVFEVILLNLRSEMIGSPVEVATGQRDRVSVDIEQVMAVIITGTSAGAMGAVLVHLHPSGHATASPSDKRLTESIRAAMKVAAPGTTLVDHVVIAPRAEKNGEFYSFADDKLFRATDIE